MPREPFLLCPPGQSAISVLSKDGFLWQKKENVVWGRGGETALSSCLLGLLKASEIGLRCGVEVESMPAESILSRRNLVTLESAILSVSNTGHDAW